MTTASYDPRTTPLRDVDIDILESLSAHRLLTTNQLWELLCRDEPRTVRWIQKSVRSLCRRDAVDWVRHRGDPRLRCWFLTQTGLDILADNGRPRRLPNRPLITADQAAGMLQRHTLAVNDVGIAFVTWARKLGHECDALAWEHEIAHRTGEHGVPLLIADALLHYTATAQRRTMLISRFVELDRATMPVQHVGEKLRRYVAYANYIPPGGSHPAWQSLYPGLPGLIVVLTGRPREELVRRRDAIFALCRVDPVLREATAPTISITILEDLQNYGPFARIFWRPGKGDAVDLIGGARRATQAARAGDG